jgi:hypothetical protein
MDVGLVPLMAQRVRQTRSVQEGGSKMLCVICCAAYIAVSAAKLGYSTAHLVASHAAGLIFPVAFAVASTAGGAGAAAVHSVHAVTTAPKANVVSAALDHVPTAAGGDTKSHVQTLVIRTAPAATRPTMSRAFARVASVQRAIQVTVAELLDPFPHERQSPPTFGL